MSDFDDNLFDDFVTNYVIVPVSDNYNYKTKKERIVNEKNLSIITYTYVMFFPGCLRG